MGAADAYAGEAVGQVPMDRLQTLEGLTHAGVGLSLGQRLPLGGADTSASGIETRPEAREPRTARPVLEMPDGLGNRLHRPDAMSLIIAVDPRERRMRRTQSLDDPPVVLVSRRITAPGVVAPATHVMPSVAPLHHGTRSVDLTAVDLLVVDLRVVDLRVLHLRLLHLRRLDLRRLDLRRLDLRRLDLRVSHRPRQGLLHGLGRANDDARRGEMWDAGGAPPLG
jgi:hypothetical protein